MEIVQYLENAKAQIKSEEDRQIAIIKDRVIREIQPKYAEIENLRNDRLNQLAADYNANRKLITEQYNAQLEAMLHKFEADQKAVAESAESKKSEILNHMLTNETYAIVKEYEKAIAKLDDQIKELKE